MRTIVPSPALPSSPTPAELAPVTCASWCADGGGHPDSREPGEQRCRSTVYRVDAPLGGGDSSDDRPTASAGLYLQADQDANEPTTYTLGLELGGSEAWLRLRRSDLRALTAARTLLIQTAHA